jgi:hypothetical protein
VAIKSLCDAGCIVTYTTENCDAKYKGKLVWQGVREPCTGLWALSLQPDPNKPEFASLSTAAPPTEETAYNVHTITLKATLIKFLHQYLLSPERQLY